MSGCNLFVEMGLKDPDGTVVLRRSFESKSWVANFARVLSYWLMPTQQWPVDINNVTGNINASRGGIVFGIAGGVGITSNGIIVGLSTTSVAITDYKLESICPHGTTANYLQYSACTFGAPLVSGSSCYFTITRDFANGCGDNVIVNEIGLIGGNFTPPEGGPTHYCLMARDVLTPGITINNGQTLTLNYLIEVSL